MSIKDILKVIKIYHKRFNLINISSSYINHHKYNEYSLYKLVVIILSVQQLNGNVNIQLHGNITKTHNKILSILSIIIIKYHYILLNAI